MMRENELIQLAEKLRGELLYLQDSGDVRDSVRNTAADGLWSTCDRLLGPIPDLEAAQ